MNGSCLCRRNSSQCGRGAGAIPGGRFEGSEGGRSPDPSAAPVVTAAQRLLPASQWLLGFAVFLLPWASPWLRGLLKPVHVFFGASILALAMASVISGINEKLFFSL